MSSRGQSGGGSTAVQCAMWGGAGEALFLQTGCPVRPPNPAPSPAFSSQSSAPASGKEVGISLAQSPAWNQWLPLHL